MTSSQFRYVRSITLTIIQQETNGVGGVRGILIHSQSLANCGKKAENGRGQRDHLKPQMGPAKHRSSCTPPSFHLMFLWTAERHEMMAQALYKAAQDKKLMPIKRFEFRMMAKRSRIIARMVRDQELKLSCSGKKTQPYEKR